jgi:hypothetical protein
MESFGVDLSFSSWVVIGRNAEKTITKEENGCSR